MYDWIVKSDNQNKFENVSVFKRLFMHGTVAMFMSLICMAWEACPRRFWFNSNNDGNKNEDVTFTNMYNERWINVVFQILVSILLKFVHFVVNLWKFYSAQGSLDMKKNCCVGNHLNSFQLILETKLIG